MSQNDSTRARLPRGVTALRRPRNGRGYRALIRRGKGVEAHLGLYETPWLAAFAHDLAARLLGRQVTPAEPPLSGQPTADQVRETTARVRRRLGLDGAERPAREVPPDPGDLLTLFEVTVVGFWRGQSAEDSGDHPERGLDAAAGRLDDAARLLFWSRGAGHPAPLDAMTRLLARRLDQSFRRADLTREVLDDDGDAPFLVARWLVHPDAFPAARHRGFRDEVRHLYTDLLEGPDDLDGDAPGRSPAWAEILGVAPPFDLESIRAAYRAGSLTAHPDAGGTDTAFVRLREAYEAARAYCASRSSP